MSEWWTYTPSDFLMFSPRTYHRLLELYNTAIWPAQLAGVAIGATIAAHLVHRRSVAGQLAVALLAACWLWVAWAFHWQRYAQINWAAAWFAAAFALQGLLLAFSANRMQFDAHGPRAWAATAVILFTIAGYPLLAVATGRPWTSAEIFGTGADPTAIATLATLASARTPLRWLLLAIPIAWCAIAVATLWTMDAPEAAIVSCVTLFAVVLSAFRARTLRQAVPQASP